VIHAVIPAAGMGTRSGLNFPKTLQIVDGNPILIRTINALAPVTKHVAVIVSPAGLDPIADTLQQYGIVAELIVQDEPLGMGDAVTRFAQSASFSATKEIVLVWGDMLAISSQLVATVLDKFHEDGSDLAFPSHFRSPCYTHVVRDTAGNVIALLERREFGDALPEEGEADCGIFVFKKEPLFHVLNEHRAALKGKATGEIGFLAAVHILATLKYRVNAYPIARDLDAAAFNSPDDLAAYSKLIELK